MVSIKCHGTAAWGAMNSASTCAGGGRLGEATRRREFSPAPCHGCNLARGPAGREKKEN